MKENEGNIYYCFIPLLLFNFYLIPVRSTNAKESILLFSSQMMNWRKAGNELVVSSFQRYYYCLDVDSLAAWLLDCLAAWLFVVGRHQMKRKDSGSLVHRFYFMNVIVYMTECTESCILHQTRILPHRNVC